MRVYIPDQTLISLL